MYNTMRVYKKLTPVVRHVRLFYIRYQCCTANNKRETVG